MTLQADRLLSHRFAPIKQSYTARDAILYALGVGLGADPLDAYDVDYLLETRLKVLPAFANALASPGMWLRDPAFGVTFGKLVHWRQEAQFHAPLPPQAHVIATPRVAGLYDRGEGRGAVLVVEREIRETTSDRPLATIRQTLLLRGDGGFGGESPPLVPVTQRLDLSPDHRLCFRISPRAALIYRLSGDYNPLHADPNFARAAGFDQPILHGLASFGLAAYLIERTLGVQLRAISCSFRGVVLPGDELDLAIWVNQGSVRFEGSVEGRPVLGDGVASSG